MKTLAVDTSRPFSGQPLVSRLGHGSRLVSVLTTLPAMVFLLLVTGCGEKKQAVSESRNYFLEARKAINAGDSATAIEALNASIESQPSEWAYLELAKQHLEQGDEEAALSNCEKVLEMDPKMPDALWFQGELKKPEAKRFKGRFKNPPSSRK